MIVQYWKWISGIVLRGDFGLSFEWQQPVSGLIWERMALATTTFLTISKSHRSLSVIAERHVLVLEALRARDPEAAEAAMRAHIDEPGQWLRAAMEEEQAQKKQKAPRARRAVRRTVAG